MVARSRLICVLQVVSWIFAIALVPDHFLFAKWVERKAKKEWWRY